MLKFLFNTLYSKKKIRNSLFKNQSRCLDFKMKVNELNDNQFQTLMTFEFEKDKNENEQKFGLRLFSKDDSNYYQVSKNNISKVFKIKNFLANNPKKDILQLKDKVIGNLIADFTKELSKVAPANSPGEEKVLEWLRVSLEVLKRAVDSIDNDKTILQYQIYFNKNSLRVIIYNLDLEIKTLEGRVFFKAFNYQNNKELYSTPVYNVEFKALYNDVFNQFILLLNHLQKKDVLN